MSKNEDIFLRKLQSTAKLVVPKGGEVWLYGSRARGDAHEDSDWDLLILLNQPSITAEDEENIAYPFVVEGWKNDIAVSPQLYTFNEWKRRSFTPYYKNVEHDKLLIR
jgi:predicted nucleotidyltransferase